MTTEEANKILDICHKLYPDVKCEIVGDHEAPTKTDKKILISKMNDLRFEMNIANAVVGSFYDIDNNIDGSHSRTFPITVDDFCHLRTKVAIYYDELKKKFNDIEKEVVRHRYKLTMTFLGNQQELFTADTFEELSRKVLAYEELRQGLSPLMERK